MSDHIEQSNLVQHSPTKQSPALPCPASTIKSSQVMFMYLHVVMTFKNYVGTLISLLLINFLTQSCITKLCNEKSVKLKVEFILKNSVAHESVLITDSNDSIFNGVLLVTTFRKVSVRNKLLCNLYKSAILPITGKHNFTLFQLIIHWQF